jgi:hypothetical protein
MLMIHNNRQISFLKGEDQLYQNKTKIFQENIEYKRVYLGQLQK